MDVLASNLDWQRLRVPAGAFVLTAYTPTRPIASSVLTVYIEGDGLAWINRSRASDNPTPNRPLGLELALRHTTGAAAYLARPCQNVTSADWGNCREEFWTNRRFSPEVIEASNLAVNALKTAFSAEKLILVGYSGGGAVAALVAARRTDVIRLVTVAGNLDTLAWTNHHHVPALTGSLNPASEWSKLQDIPQMHFVGGKDSNISSEILDAYIDRFPVSKRPQRRVVAGFDHACCWAEQWPALAHEAFPEVSAEP